MARSLNERITGELFTEEAGGQAEEDCMLHGSRMKMLSQKFINAQTILVLELCPAM